jgi:predicted DNA-binding transcriptional regulator AlpA
MADTTGFLPPADDPIISGWRRASVKTGRSVPSLKRDVRAGRFPPPLELGSNQIGWRQSWIDDWLASRPRRTYRRSDASESTHVTKASGGPLTTKRISVAVDGSLKSDGPRGSCRPT